MRITPERDAVTIVLVGDFNPKIFRPGWFGEQGILDEKEVEVAEIEIIHSEVAKFQIDWLRVQVDKRRFIAEVNESPHVRLLDLVVRTFGEFLVHTPVGMLGINRLVHFPVQSRESMDNIGKALAPQNAWGEWGEQIEGSDPAKHGGMRSLTMEQRDLSDRNRGWIRAKVEASTQVTPGVFVDINDHYEADNPEEVTGCSDIVSMLQANFENSIRRSEWIIDQVMALAPGRN